MVKNLSESVSVAGRELKFGMNMINSGYFSDKFWIFLQKMSRIDLNLSVSGSQKIKFGMISFAIKFFKTLFS
jgi:hypothetical protein